MFSSNTKLSHIICTPSRKPSLKFSISLVAVISSCAFTRALNKFRLSPDNSFIKVLSLSQNVFIAFAYCDDKYVLRHYDVWNKSCPAQWANANSAGWTAFKEMVKSILKESEEEPMATAEKKEFDALKKQVEELKEKTGYFNYIDKNMNDSYKPTVQKLVNAGKLRGNENGELMLTNDMMRILTILDRCGIFD